MQRKLRQTFSRVLIIAVLLSVLVHLIAGGLLYTFRDRHADDRREVVTHVDEVTLTRLRPTPPPPTPTPEPTPTPLITPTPLPTPTPQPTPTPVVTPTPPPKTPPPVKEPEKVVKSAPAGPPKLHIRAPHITSQAKNSAGEAHSTAAKTSSEGAEQGAGIAGQGNGPGNDAAATSPAPVSTTASCAHPSAAARVVDGQQIETPDDAQGASGTVLVQVDLSAESKILKVSIYKSSGNAALDRAALNGTPQTTFQTGRLNCVDIPASYIFRVNFDSE